MVAVKSEGIECEFGSVPIPDLQGNYPLFKKEVRLWAAITAIETKRQAGTLICELPLKAKQEALELPVQVLQFGRTATDQNGVEQKLCGVECLLEKLDEIYLEDVSKEQYKCYDKFKNLQRKEGQSVRDYILVFDQAVRSLTEHGIELPTAVLAYELLRSCNVPEYQYSIAVAIVEEMTYENMRRTVRKICDIKCPYDQRHRNMMSNNDQGNVVIKKKNDKLQSRVDLKERSQKRSHFSELKRYEIPEEKCLRTTNPVDQDGNRKTCYVCCSMFHLVKHCPLKTRIRRNRKQRRFRNNHSVALLEEAMTIKTDNLDKEEPSVESEKDLSPHSQPSSRENRKEESEEPDKERFCNATLVCDDDILNRYQTQRKDGKDTNLFKDVVIKDNITPDQFCYEEFSKVVLLIATLYKIWTLQSLLMCHVFLQENQSGKLYHDHVGGHGNFVMNEGKRTLDQCVVRSSVIAKIFGAMDFEKMKKC